jgi:S1-C subfamily serine protease
MSKPSTRMICQAALLAATVAGYALYNSHSRGTAVAATPSAAPVVQSEKSEAVPAAITIADVVKATKFSIGRIVTRTPIAYRDGSTAQASGTGTGFLIDQSGDMVTNCHVVSAPTVADASASGPTVIEVIFPDKPDLHLAATVTGCDEPGDIAVLKVAGVGAWRTPLRFANPKTIEVGQDAITVGFAEGIAGDPTVAHGIVSALHRSFLEGAVSDLIQTEATINHGNSGGPLLNLRGEVIGVNTYTSGMFVKMGAQGQAVPVSTTGVNIYFARSAASASRYVADIITAGQVSRARFGFAVETANSDKLPLPQRGAIVSGIDIIGAATRDVQAGDVITAVVWSNGYRYATPDEGSWNDALSLIKPGQVVRLQAYRMTETGIRAVKAMREAPASEVRTFEAMVMAPPAGLARLAIPADVVNKLDLVSPKP